VIDFGVEQFHNQVHASRFGVFGHQAQTFDGVLGAFLLAFAVAIAAKANQVRNLELLGVFQAGAQFIGDARVILFFVQPIFERLVTADGREWRNPDRETSDNRFWAASRRRDTDFEYSFKVLLAQLADSQWLTDCLNEDTVAPFTK
jgi:hypothetical protein